MTKEEERELIVAWRERGDAAALKTLIDQHKPLIRSQASKYVSPRADMDDYQQHGAIGIMRAAETFDLESDNRFVTYARWFTMDDISRFGRSNSTAVFVPQGQMFGKSKGVWDAWHEEKKRAEAAGEDCSEAAITQRVAEALGVTKNRVMNALAVRNMREHHTDAPGRSGDEESEQRLPDQMTEKTTAEDLYARSQAENTTISILAEVMGALDDRERDIIKRRRLGGETLEQVAVTYGLSRERIRQIEMRAIEKMAEAGAARADEARFCLSAMTA